MLRCRFPAPPLKCIGGKKPNEVQSARSHSTEKHEEFKPTLAAKSNNGVAAKAQEPCWLYKCLSLLLQAHGYFARSWLVQVGFEFAYPQNNLPQSRLAVKHKLLWRWPLVKAGPLSWYLKTQGWHKLNWDLPVYHLKQLHGTDPCCKLTHTRDCVCVCVLCSAPGSPSAFIYSV